MKIPFFDLGAQLNQYRSALHAALDRTIDSGAFIGGASVERFEESFAGSTRAKHCAAVGNGLDAIRMILEALGIGEGDEVIVPAFTFYATWLAVMQVGATPVFVDVESKSANIDVTKIEKAITTSTRAILVVHLFGQLVDTASVKRICDKSNLFLIEDCAQSHLAQNSQGTAGSFGVAAAFSFYPTKNLGALGDAGAVITNDLEIFKFVNSRRSYGRGDNKYEHVDLGWNSRLDSLQAEFLSLHLTKLQEFTSTRRRIAQSYITAMGDSAHKVIGPLDVAESVWHHFPVVSINRTRSREILEGMGVASDIHYPYFAGSLSPVNKYLLERNVFINMEDFPVAETLSNEVFSLPIGPWMKQDQIDFVSSALRDKNFLRSLGEL